MVFAIGEQVVERRRVGERRPLAHRRVEALFLVVAVRFERPRVEPHKRRAHSLRPHDALDGGVEARDGRFLAGNEAGHDGRIVGRLQIGAIPCTGDGGIFKRFAAAHAEHEVAAREQRLPRRSHDRIIDRSCGIPRLEEAADGRRRRRIHVGEKRKMPLPRRLEALARPVGFALRIDAEQVRGVVAQQVRGDSDGSLRLLGNRPRPSALFFGGDNAHEPPLKRQLQHERHLPGTPAGARHAVGMLGNQVLVIVGERLQDHRSTSLPATSITPLRMTARKNIGVMFCGSA